METLRTIFPYSLNERTRKYDSEVPVVKLFFSTPRTEQRSSRYRNNKDFLKNNTITELLTKANGGRGGSCLVERSQRNFFLLTS